MHGKCMHKKYMHMKYMHKEYMSIVLCTYNAMCSGAERVWAVR